MSVPLYSRMSVTSKNEIRYEGILVAVNAETATLTLAQVSENQEADDAFSKGTTLIFFIV